MRWETTDPCTNPKKRDDDWRIIGININNFPSENNGLDKAKQDLLKKTISECDPEIVGITELGRNEDNIPYQMRPSNVIKKWTEKGTAQAAWNKRNTLSKYEPGGVLLTTSGKCTSHVIKKGKDNRNLGRWTWITVKGKQHTQTTIITVYRPTNQQITAQNQLGTLRKIHTVKQPEEFWEDDLATLITEKKELGGVIAIGDFNDDLNRFDGKVNTFFRNLDMRELLNEKYGEGPATHSFGSTKIDGIFGTTAIFIRQGGYGGMGLSPSDHLYPWIDIAAGDIVGYERDDRPPPVLRKTTSKIPSVKKSFNTKLNQEIMNHKLHSKTKKLMETAKKNKQLTDEEAKEYERIEQRIRRGVKYADSCCRKARMGKVSFSEKQKKLMGHIYVLKLIWLRRKLRGRAGRPHSRKLQREAKKYKYDGPLGFDSLQQIEEALSTAAGVYNRFRPKAYEARLTYQEQLAHEMAMESERDPEKVYKELLHAFQVKEHFKNIRRKEKRGARHGVDRIDIEVNGTLQTTVNKIEIENGILHANKAKLLQANDTPLRTEPLRTIIGERMKYAEWEKLLKKEIDIPEDLEEGTKLWFNSIQDFDDNPIEIDWTTEEYFDNWKKMSEDKSALPGVQAAHLKSIDPQSDAADVVSWMALIPLITGYAPKQWMQGIDSMIPKKKNEWRPEKLRLILLMEARFNQNNKLIGRKMLQHGERHGYLAREQFGSRNDKSAIEHALNKRLTIDIARQTKIPAAYIANDAKSCYDRILLMVAYLTMRHMGIPENTAISSIETLAQMTRTIKTVYGESEGTYATNTSLDEILHGIGQGNGYGPTIWAGISSPLLKILRQRKHGVHLFSPITNEEIKMAGYSYVDDTDQLELNCEETIWDNVLDNAQASLELWECLLRTTGGAIEPSKTFWVRIAHEWKNGRPVLKKADQTEELWVKNSSGTPEKIEQIDPSTARRTLGVWQAADGQEDTQTAVLLSKIKNWGEHSTGMTKKESSTAMVSTIGRAIRYPLAATTLSTQQCKEVDISFKQNVLGKMGVVRTAPDKVVFSPTKLGGIGLHMTEIDQTIDHVKMIMQHGHQDTVTGTLLRNTLEQIAIDAGQGGNPFEFEPDLLSYTTERTWIQNTIQSCSKFKIHIESPFQGIPKWTTKDIYLMDRAIHTLKGKELKIFNKVRLSLKIATVADLAVADGSRIDNQILLGNTSMSPTPSRWAYTWPLIPDPTNLEKKVWTRALGSVFHLTEGNPTLDTTNYRWFHPECIVLSCWNINLHSGNILEKTDKEWIVWTPDEATVRRTRRTARYTRSEQTVSSLLHKEHCRPITVERHNIKISIKSRGRYHYEAEDQSHTTPWYLPESTTLDNTAIETFTTAVQQGTGLVVADGSYKTGRSAAAIIFQHTKNNGQIENNNTYSVTVPGHTDEQSSYRGELGGILSGLANSHRLLHKNGITSGKCVFGCDNKGALEASFGWKTPNPNWACFDLVSEIRNQLRLSPITWTMKHVKGHQDSDKAYEQLSVEAQANVIVDKKAKEELSKEETPQEQSPRSGDMWHLTCAGHRITGDTETRLRYYMQETESKLWWCNKLKVPAEYYQQVSWPVYNGYRKNTPRWIHTWSVKFGADILPTRRNIVRRGHGKNHECPCCGEPNETAQHLFLCQDAEMHKAFEEEMDKISDYLQITTSNAIKTHLLSTLRWFRTGNATNGAAGAAPHSSLQDQAAFHQRRLGLTASLNGIWHNDWITSQHIYLRQIRSRCSARVWMIRFAILCQKMLHTLWKVRNEAIHRREDSDNNKRRNADLDSKITEIFRSLPNLRLLPQSDAAFFKRGEEKIKRYRLTRKELWIEDATRIRDAFHDSLDAQSASFLNYFGSTTL